MDRSFVQRVRTFFFAEFAPATKAVLILQLAIFSASLLFPVENFLVLDPFRFSGRPWTIVTYWTVNGNVLDFLFSGLWWWYIGGSMERFWGTRRFITAWLVIVAATGGGLLAGAVLSNTLFEIARWFPAMAGLTLAWGFTHAGQEVLLYGLLPIKSQWFAWLSAGLMVFSYIGLHWLVGLLSLSGCGAGYLLCRVWPGRRLRRPGVRSQRRPASRLRRVK